MTNETDKPLALEDVEKYEKEGWPEFMNWPEASAAIALGHAVASHEFPYPLIFGVQQGNQVVLLVEIAGKITPFSVQPLLITRSVSVRTWKLDDPRLLALQTKAESPIDMDPV